LANASRSSQVSSGFLLPQLTSEQTIISKLSAVPRDKDGYKPDATFKSARELAWHVAVIEVWFLDAVIQRRFGQTAAMPAKVKRGHCSALAPSKSCPALILLRASISSVCRTIQRRPT
jgi:hypothetical protein